MAETPLQRGRVVSDSDAEPQPGIQAARQSVAELLESDRLRRIEDIKTAVTRHAYLSVWTPSSALAADIIATAVEELGLTAAVKAAMGVPAIETEDDTRLFGTHIREAWHALTGR